MSEVKIYVRKYLLLDNTSQYNIWRKLGYLPKPEEGINEWDLNFFKYVKENDKFDTLVVILDNPGISTDEIRSKVRQRKLDKVL